MRGCPYDAVRPDPPPRKRREGPADISSMSFADKQAAMRLWKDHGGNHHGPNVETVTMPMNAFWSFLEAYAKSLKPNTDASAPERPRLPQDERGWSPD